MRNIHSQPQDLFFATGLRILKGVKVISTGLPACRVPQRVCTSVGAGPRNGIPSFGPEFQSGIQIAFGNTRKFWPSWVKIAVTHPMCVACAVI
jgi:hypothetical protein